MLQALREDGSPPAYYFLLHGWMSLFGHGDEAVRALSVVFSLAALVVAYIAGNRVGGTSTGRAAVIILGACPFAVRYATETRMYSMLILLSLLGIVCLSRADEQPTVRRLIPVTIISGLLALTHYWALFLLTLTGCVLVYRWCRGIRAPAARRELLAMIGGAVLFVPWMPAFLFQVRHTGTPWAAPPEADQFFVTAQRWWGTGSGSAILYLVSIALVMLAVFGRSRLVGSGEAGPSRGPDRDQLAPMGGVWLGRPVSGVAVVLTIAAFGTLALGLAFSNVLRSGYSLRYSAPALGPAVLLLALGAQALEPHTRRWLLAGFAVVGLLVTGAAPFLTTRTQAQQTAGLLRATLGPDDLVIYCPDQLGPAVARQLPANTAQVAYPSLSDPHRVDWVDYERRNSAASPSTIASQLNTRVTGRIFLVRADNYRTFGNQCATLAQNLARLRGAGTVLQRPNNRYGEPQYLIRFPARAS
ncbi:MAG: hypothetical protein JWM76_63 [Pseudonocardiales bacterium]|nr:hypothetical protein [Pseudonocardiales bacterium]